MLSVIIATHESERALVRTLAALVPGSTAGLISEVIVADGGSADATAEVADVAGCHFMQSAGPRGARLKTAANGARGRWLMFLHAGAVPEPAWVEEADRFIISAERLDQAERAAVFRAQPAAGALRPGFAEVAQLVRSILGGGARPEQGLLIARRFYDRLGGHPEGGEAEAVLLRRIGRHRLAMLGAGLYPARRDT
ncbi:MAG TPA: glycosyltransferase [Pseudolabrys sp.]|nr:glycosyltransferase [Pseudolabrys sp.]